MQQELMKFMVNHWELCLAFILILIYWILSEMAELKSSRHVNSADVVHLINRENAIVIDIRESNSFESGHILGAISFPEKTFFDKLSQLKKYQQRYIVIVDNNGAAANKMINKFIKEGFEKAHYLKGGMHAWMQSKLPLERIENTKKLRG